MLTVLTVLGVAAAAVWVPVLHGERDTTHRVSCPPPPGNPTAVPLPYRALRDVAPLPPAQVEVRVRNATGQRGLAARVTTRLRMFGFAAVEPDNDSRYPTGALHCTAQIRFGWGGRAAARTVSLLAPCAQLVRDGRDDATVDLALGTGFIELAPNRQAREVLRRLREPAAEGQRSTGGLQSLTTAPTAPPLTDARTGRC